MLSVEERTRILAVARQSTEKAIFAGIVACSTHDCMAQIEAIGDLKVQALLVRTPSFYGSQLDQVEFFQKISEFSPIPVMVYQIPQYTGIRLNREALTEIARMPNVVGIKDSFGDLALLEGSVWPPDFQYFLGSAAVMRCGMGAGAAGGILAVANVFPEECRAFLEACLDDGRRDEARLAQRRLTALGSRLSGGALGLAGLKAACEIRGFKGGAPRSPLRPVSSQQRESLETFLATLF